MTTDIKDKLQRLPYRIKMMFAIVISELIAIGFVLFWPVPGPNQSPYQDVIFSDSEVVMEDVTITQQKSTPPPPPSPQVPVPVPNNQIIEEDPIVLEEIDLNQFSEAFEQEGQGERGETDKVAANPQLPPSVVRIVEPTFSQAALDLDYKVEVIITFLVNYDGSVEEASIAEIRVFDQQDDGYRVVDHINYGIMEATLEAALRWRFRPAKNEGEVVRSYVSHHVTLGS